MLVQWREQGEWAGIEKAQFQGSHLKQPWEIIDICTGVRHMMELELLNRRCEEGRGLEEFPPISEPRRLTQFPKMSNEGPQFDCDVVLETYLVLPG